MSRAPSASLRLAGLDVPIVWPRQAPTGLLVLLDATASQELADRLGAIILSAPPAHAATVIGWAADHAAEFGVDGPLLLAGAGAHALARDLDRDGWPEIALITA